MVSGVGERMYSLFYFGLWGSCFATAAHMLLLLSSERGKGKARVRGGKGLLIHPSADLVVLMSVCR